MPSTSPGSLEAFSQLLPGAPTPSLQSLATFEYREKRYIAYLSGRQLSILASPTTLVQASTFPEELVALVVESESGKLCVCSAGNVWVLEAVVESWTRVSWEKTLLLCRKDAEDAACTLSWGNEGELLVGGKKALSLFSTLPSSRQGSPATSLKEHPRGLEERNPLWTVPVASPVQWASFSPSASLIASASPYSRLVKLWRRLSYEEGLFDHAYLPHGQSAVTHLEWRPLDAHAEERRGSGVSGRHDEDPEVLYTVASDGVLRVWRTGGIHDLELMVLHTTVDLVAAIPHSPTLTTHGRSQQPKPLRYVFILPAADFSKAVASALGAHGQTKGGLSHSLEHLKEVSSKHPDVIVALDRHGRMSAWGLQSIGHKRRPETPGSKQAFHIAHCEDLGVKFPGGGDGNARFVAWFEGQGLNVLVHGFEGRVGWWEGQLEGFFSPSAPGKERLARRGEWAGMMGQVVGVRRFGDMGLVVSWTAEGGVVVWSQDAESSELIKKSSCSIGSMPLDAIWLPALGSVLLVTATQLALWRPRDGKLTAIDRESDSADAIRLLPPYRDRSPTRQYYGSVLTCGDRSNRYTININDNSDIELSISPHTISTMPTIEGHGEILHVQPIDNEPRGAIILVFEDGVTARTEHGPGRKDIPKSRTMELDAVFQTSTKALFRTDMPKPSTLAANAQFAALASEDGREVCVLDLREGYVEYRHSMSEKVRHLSFFVSEAGHTLLAVGYEQHVEILAQGRYEPLTKQATWLMVKTVPMQRLGLSIGALDWTADGKVIVAAGNGLIVANDKVAVRALSDEAKQAVHLPEEGNLGLGDLAERLTGSVPIWHPRLLSYLVMHHGSTGPATRALVQLLAKLKFWSEGDDLDPLLDMGLTAILEFKGECGFVEQSTVAGLAEQLSEKRLPGLSTAEQTRLRTVINAIAYISEHSNGLDANAIRYLYTWRLLNAEPKDQDLQTATPNSLTSGTEPPPSPTPPQIPWSAILYAYHSTTQAPLLDHLLSLPTHTPLTWPLARSLGLPLWLRDLPALQTLFITLAQSAYRAQNPPDPVDSSLYHLALGKKATLLQLWRIATWHREQRSTMNFLKKDFENNAEARTAARKNAYALMGKRRFEYAAAFFLLAGDVDAAVGLLAGQCGDVGLAIGVARLVSGDRGLALKRVVEERVVAGLREEGDRWGLSWGLEMTGRKREAAEVLIAPLEGMVRRWRQDDPLALVLYPPGLKVSLPELEYKAVLRAAMVLRRMGLDLFALDLVKNWTFKAPSPAVSAFSDEVGVKAEAEAEAEVEAKKEADAEPEASVPKANGTNGATAQPKYMLDDFSASAPKQPPSMLDAFDEPPTSKPVDDEKTAREAKAAALMAKMKAKKQAAAAPTAADEKKDDEKRKPTQFKEPSANSLLDSFGF